MTATDALTRVGVRPDRSELSGAATSGWYLYGITRREPLATTDTRSPSMTDDDGAHGGTASVQRIEFADLAAIVAPVDLADYEPAVLQERLRDASTLETMVRSHNRVIDAVHARQPILPARFGSVYVHASDLLAALQPLHDTLLAQLACLEGCDEWAVHIYVDGAAVRERIAADDPSLRRLREQCAAARPGRAFFLERQLQDQLATTTRASLLGFAQHAFDVLAECAVAGRATQVGVAAGEEVEVEILRAAFLVARDGIAQFDTALCAIGDDGPGLRCESSGPWPPYSFAIPLHEEAR